MAGDTISEHTLKRFLMTVLERAGVNADAARRAVDVFVEADMRGIESHGVAGLPNRVLQIAEGKLNANATPTLVRQIGATALFDGHQGFGPVLCSIVIETAVKLAAEHGIGLVAIRDSSHWACPAYYSRWMALQGFIGMSMTNTNPGMPLWGSSEKSVTNSPYAVAAPHRGHEPIVLDMSLQQVSWSGMKLAADDGVKLPGLWGYDEQGKETDDPVVIARTGRVKPIGDYKGSGFAFMQEILTGVLGAGMISAQIGAMTQKGEPAHYSQTFIAIRPDLFATGDEYAAHIDLLYETAKQAPLAEGFSDINLPGDRSNATLAVRRRDGIPLKRIRKALEEFSATYNLPQPWL
ncbi:MAG TPA: Ldh family oxidoreductase [Arsenicitalea sp.]|jgi:LDH2 family malate/lactate/ureidoglycolate dehydrogenase|nr:Ldh family oxidoreductase [Arsenicitalea sp.]